MEELEEILKNLKYYRSILYNEGYEKYEKSIHIINSYSDFILNLKLEYENIDIESEEWNSVNRILDDIRLFIIKMNKSMGHE